MIGTDTTGLIFQGRKHGGVILTTDRLTKAKISYQHINSRYQLSGPDAELLNKILTGLLQICCGTTTHSVLNQLPGKQGSTDKHQQHH